MDSPHVSIIVPIYKVENYLDKCVKSIINQTYKNIEIILVDDGSPDACPQKCDEWAKKDNRIKVIHKRNGGLSDARNVGIDSAIGDFITFIDSDDYIEPTFIEYLLNLIKKYNADISICEYKYIKEDGSIFNHPKNNGKEIVYNSEKAILELLKSKLFTNSAWGKLYKKALFAKIRYPYGRLYEDIPTTYKTFFLSNRIVFGSKTLYNYLYRKSAISKQQFNQNRLDALIFTEEMIKDVITKYPKFKAVANGRLMEECCYLLEILPIEDNFSLAVEVYEKIKSVRLNVLLGKDNILKRRIFSLASYLGLKGYVKFLRAV